MGTTEEQNKELLEQLINDTLAYVKEHPEDEKQQENLRELLKASTEHYRWSTQYWNGLEANNNEANKIELQKKELEIRSQELEQTKKRDRGDFIAKISGTAAAMGTAILATKWESVGEFVHGIALKIGPKFHS